MFETTIRSLYIERVDKNRNCIGILATRMNIVNECQSDVILDRYYLYRRTYQELRNRVLIRS
nr:MAG TPA: hypothetical protein [Caudoviricetes sp.]